MSWRFLWGHGDRERLQVGTTRACTTEGLDIASWDTVVLTVHHQLDFLVSCVLWAVEARHKRIQLADGDNA